MTCCRCLCIKNKTKSDFCEVNSHLLHLLAVKSIVLWGTLTHECWQIFQNANGQIQNRAPLISLETERMFCTFQFTIQTICSVTARGGKKNVQKGLMRCEETGRQLTSLDKRVNTSPPLRKSSIKYSFPSVWKAERKKRKQWIGNPAELNIVTSHVCMYQLKKASAKKKTFFAKQKSEASSGCPWYFWGWASSPMNCLYRKSFIFSSKSQRPINQWT